MTAQKEPSLIQKDLLAMKLVGPNLHLPEAEESCNLARIQLCNTARPRLIRPDRLDLLEAEEPCDLARVELYNTAKASSGLLEVGLYTDIGMGQL